MTGVALYSPYKTFPESLLIRTDVPLTVKTNRTPSIAATQYVLGRDRHAITLNLMDPAAIGEHLRGFCGFVAQICGGKLHRRGREIAEQIGRTRMVIGVIIEPEDLDPEPALGVVAAVAEMTGSMMFIRGTLLDCEDRVILAPDGTYDRKARVNPLAPARPWWRWW